MFGCYPGWKFLDMLMQFLLYLQWVNIAQDVVRIHWHEQFFASFVLGNCSSCCWSVEIFQHPDMPTCSGCWCYAGI